jgi:hypothetical protein
MNSLPDDYEIPFSLNSDDRDRVGEARDAAADPEDYFQYKTELIIPEAQKTFKEITKDWQLGNLSKEDFNKFQFGFGLAVLCLRYKKTLKAGMHILSELNAFIVSSNSKEGFLRKQEGTQTKISKVEQSKVKKVAERSQW